MPREKIDAMPEGATVLLDDGEFQEVFGDWRDRIRKALRPGEPWALVGVKRRGSVLARRLREEFRKEIPDLEYGELDISLYRDDYHLQLSQPRVLGTEINFSVDGRRILLVDDVLYTGRTVRAALDLILDFGRPRNVLLAVFVDRGNRELPIAPDFVGKVISTQREDRVRVRLVETDREDCVFLVKAGG